MFMNLKFLMFLFIVIFTACGGGGSSDTNIEPDIKSELSSGYEGKRLQVELNPKNYKKIVQSLHYLFDDSELDDKEQLDTVVEGRVVKQNINRQTGIGTISYTYEDFQIRDSEEVWTGSINLNVIEVNRVTEVVKINVTYDLNIEKFDDEISLFIHLDTTVDTKRNTETLVVKKYRLKSKKNQLDTEVINFEYANTSLKKGRIYIASEGYINFTLTNSGYEMVDLTNSKTVVKYLNEEIVLNGQIDKKLYYKGSRVAHSPFPIIQYEEIDLNNTLIDTNLTVLHATDKDTFTHQTAKWYINGKKIKDIDNIKLSRKFFKKTDNVKVVLGVYNDDACSVKVIENYTVPNAEPIVTIIKNNPNPLNSAHIVSSNSLEFTVESFNIFDADGDTINLTWSASDYSEGKVEVVATTNSLEHPTVRLEEYGTVQLYVYIEDVDGTVFTRDIWLDVRPDIFESTQYIYSNFNLYSDVQAVSMEDMNADGLKDMVVIIEGTDSEGGSDPRRVEIFYQDINNNFHSPKVFPISSAWYHTKASLILKDMNSDGLIDIAINYKGSNDTGGVVVYHQTSVETFVKSSTHTLGASVSSLVATDFNADNKIDFISLTNKTGTSLGNLKMDFLNQENGVFNLNSTIDEADFTFDSQLKLGDFNGDNKDDILLVSNKNGAKVQVHMNNSTEKNNYDISTNIDNRYIGYNTIVVNDFNADGYDDVVFGVGLSYAAPSLNRFEDIKKDVYVMYSTGSSGVLTAPVKLNIAVEEGYEVLKVGDINGDNNQDLLIFKDQNMIVYLNDNGTYVKYSRTLHVSDQYNLKSEHIVVTDINNDGLDDVVIAPDDNELLIGISKL